VPTFVNGVVSRSQRGGSPTVVNLSFLERKTDFDTLMMEVIRSSGMSVITIATLHNIREDGILFIAHVFNFLRSPVPCFNIEGGSRFE
jgi:hypothetical protein